MKVTGFQKVKCILQRVRKQGKDERRQEGETEKGKGSRVVSVRSQRNSNGQMLNGVLLNISKHSGHQSLPTHKQLLELP